MARHWLKARRLELQRVDGHLRPLAFMARTRTRAARALLTAILVADSTGSGGGLVALSWTSWDGLWCSLAVAVKQGGEGWCSGSVAVVAGVVQGTRGQGFRRQTREEGEREPEEVAGVLCTIVCSAPLLHRLRRRRPARQNGRKTKSFEF